MFRLGSRAARKRMSSPPEPSTSSFSPLSVVIDTGTSLAFSTRRCAVTCRVSSTAGARVVASVDSCAKAGLAADNVARARTSGCTAGKRPRTARFKDMARALSGVV